MPSECSARPLTCGGNINSCGSSQPGAPHKIYQNVTSSHALGRNHKNQHLVGAENSAPDDGNSVRMPPPTSSTKNLSALDAASGAAGRDKSVHDVADDDVRRSMKECPTC